MNIQQELTQYIASAIHNELPDETQKNTRFHLLDTLVAILTGRLLPPGKKAFEFAKSQGGNPESTLIGNDIKVSAIHAGLSNGMAAHADETDDTHTNGRFHPGCAIVPAALAIAEKENSSHSDLLKAIALGYDVGVRINMSMGYKTPKTTIFATHSIGTIFGAAVAAGSLLKLNQEQCNYLLSYTIQQTSGLACWNRDKEHIEKAFVFSGMTTRNGIYSALLAKENFTSVEDPLLGHRGLLEAFAHNPKPEIITKDLGTIFEIDNTSIKKWCVGSPIQAILDAIEAILKQKQFDHKEIKEIKIDIPADRFDIVSDRTIPNICAQHLAALYIVKKTIGYNEVHDEKLFTDKEVLEVRKKIIAVPSEELAIARPERQAKVKIIFNDNSELSHHAKAVRGTTDNPMNEEEISNKAKELLKSYSKNQVDQLIQLVLHEDFKIKDLMEVLNFKI